MTGPNYHGGGWQPQANIVSKTLVKQRKDAPPSQIVNRAGYRFRTQPGPGYVVMAIGLINCSLWGDTGRHHVSVNQHWSHWYLLRSFKSNTGPPTHISLPWSGYFVLSWAGLLHFDLLPSCVDCVSGPTRCQPLAETFLLLTSVARITE